MRSRWSRGSYKKHRRCHDFDTVVMALNAAQSANPIAAHKMQPIPAFEPSALPVALEKNMGILSMKVMGQGMLVGSGTGRAAASELLQFNLSQPVASIIIGVEKMAPLEEKAQTARAMTPMTDSPGQRFQEKWPGRVPRGSVFCNPTATRGRSRPGSR